jgi:hypothetical protein
MNEIELTNEEQEALSQVLQSTLAMLELEILHTDHKEFKDLLRNRRRVLKDLLAKVHGPMAVLA